MKVFIDTNFLLIPYKFKVDIFTEVRRLVDAPEFAIVEKTFDELQKIKETGSGEDRTAAHIGMELLGAFKPIVLKGEGTVDDLLVENATAKEAVCTMDRYLKERLKKKGVQVISLRGKSHLELV